jgi:hypothetical protein
VSVSDPSHPSPADATGRNGEPPALAPGETIDLRTLGSLAAWTRATQGEPAFRTVCATAAVAPEAFSNGGDRVPVSRLGEWLSALRDRLGGDGALVAAGMASEASGAAPPKWLQLFATPGLLYRGRVGRRWLTAGTGRMAVHQRALCRAVVRYTAAEGQSRAMCLWRQSRLAQRPRAWGLPPAVVREMRCLAHGDEACEYVVHWHARARWTATVVAACVTSTGLSWTGAAPGIAWSLPAIVASLVYAIEGERVRRANRATDDAFAVAFRRATSSAVRFDSFDAEVAAEPAPIDADRASLRREGDFWRVSYASKIVLVRHSRGLSLLVHLLRNPNQEIHVSALDALIPSDTALPMAPSAPVEAEVADLGDAGEVLDAQAKAAYRRRLIELREELEDAERCNDLGRVERLSAELEALTDQLRAATGLGGRSRRASSNADRVRVAVTRRIRAAIAQIEKHHPPLGAHLAATIHTGYFCSYGPGGIPWEV